MTIEQPRHVLFIISGKFQIVLDQGLEIKIFRLRILWNLKAEEMSFGKVEAFAVAS